MQRTNSFQKYHTVALAVGILAFAQPCVAQGNGALTTGSGSNSCVTPQSVTFQSQFVAFDVPAGFAAAEILHNSFLAQRSADSFLEWERYAREPKNPRCSVELTVEEAAAPSLPSDFPAFQAIFVEHEKYRRIAEALMASISFHISPDVEDIRIRSIPVKDENGVLAATAFVVDSSTSETIPVTYIEVIAGHVLIEIKVVGVYVPNGLSQSHNDQEKLVQRIIQSFVLRKAALRKPDPKPDPAEISPEPQPAPTLSSNPVDTCGAVNVLGAWQAGVAVSLPNLQVDMSFRFLPDGRYAYSAGQGNFLWTAHSGSYSLTPNFADPRYRCLVTLTPDPATIQRNPQNPYGLAPLQQRNLMDDQPRTFRVSDNIAPGRLIFFDAALNRNGVGMFTLERAQ
jgi:hypothetical protein